MNRVVQLADAIRWRFRVGSDFVRGEAPLLNRHREFDFLFGGQELDAADVAQINRRWSFAREVAVVGRFFCLRTTVVTQAILGLFHECPISEGREIIPVKRSLFD